MGSDYPFEVNEVYPIYLTEAEAETRMEQLIAELLEILNGE